MKKSLIYLMTALTLSGLGYADAMAASLVAEVNVQKQEMTVIRDGVVVYNWKVSTARRGYITPPGTYRPQRMHVMWRSRKYNNSPMPYSIFYHKGYAIHGTSMVRRLGSPASHGCVRLQTENARTLFQLVKEAGHDNTEIIVK